MHVRSQIPDPRFYDALSRAHPYPANIEKIVWSGMTINLKLRTRLSPMQTIFALFVHGTPVAPSQRWRDNQANPKSNLKLAHQVIRDRLLARSFVAPRRNLLPPQTLIFLLSQICMYLLLQCWKYMQKGIGQHRREQWTLIGVMEKQEHIRKAHLVRIIGNEK